MLGQPVADVVPSATFAAGTPATISPLASPILEVEGVESVTVCHKSGKCAVVAKDGAYVCPVKVTKTIEATGFKVAQQ